jgi:hypothetical protein
MAHEKEKERLGTDVAAVAGAGSIASPERQAHTPGPWMLHPRFPEYVVPAADSRKGIGGSVDPVQEHERYAKLIHQVTYTEHPQFHASRVTKAEAQANAHLIAAAPDLLASLKEMEQMLHLWMRDNTGPNELDVLERCERALAKAEGK